MNTIELLRSEYERSASLYSAGSPLYVGRLVLSQEAIANSTANLNEIFDLTIDTLNENPKLTGSFAATFGQLAIYLALDGQPSSFKLCSKASYPKGEVAELNTSEKRQPSKFFDYQNTDGPLSFVLCDQETLAELALVQALHMFDTAIVTEQSRPGEIVRPQVFMADQDALLKLRTDNPQLLLRMYGNARNLSEAPEILGIVAPTALLEKSGVDFVESSGNCQKKPEEIIARDAFVGITTAKKPHIGHGFLIVKALGEVGEEGQVIVELNDRGPRVAAMVEKLALDLGRTFEEVADLVTDGEIDQVAIETAYVGRGTSSNKVLPLGFSLTRPNLFYRRLLSRISPKPNSLVGISDAEAIRALLPILKAKAGFVPVFGDSGAGILCGDEKAMLIEKGGDTTVAGLLGALSGRGSLTVVDSPPPLSRVQLGILSENNLEVSLTPGMGVSLDFEVGSGTKGNSLAIETLLECLVGAGLGPQQLLLVLRDMLDKAYYIQGDGNSLNPNFASVSALEVDFLSSVAAVKDGQVEVSRLFAPLKLVDITRKLAASILGVSFPECASGRTTYESILQFIDTFPVLVSKLSSRLVTDIGQNKEGAVSKSMFSERDRTLLDAIRTANPKTIFGLCLESCKDPSPEFLDKLSKGELGQAALKMGYTTDQFTSFFAKLKNAGSVYAAIKK